MTNKNYNSGRNFEYRVKKFLEQKGYYVMRSAGSKSPFDLIAIPTDEDITLLPEILLIQCKHGSKISKKERDGIKELENKFSCNSSCMVAWVKSGGQIEFYWWAYGVHVGRKWVKLEWLNQ